jgi:hypothetical protein
LSHAAAGFLGFHAPREEVIPERLWWLGGKTIERRDVDLFLARGAHWDDASQVFLRNGRVRECMTPLILVTHEVPALSPFPSTAPVRSLTSLLRCEADALQLRQEQLVGTIRSTGSRRQQKIVPIPTPYGTTWYQVLIEFANDDYVQIGIGKERYTRSFADMGFTDGYGERQNYARLRKRRSKAMHEIGCGEHR